MRIDGHVHSNFCPHGTDAPMEEYVLQAIGKGLDVITFTEHAPLPRGFTDPVPEKDSAMKAEDVPAYLAEGLRLQQQYAGKIDVRTGFEVDYIEGFEQETLAFLTTYPENAANSILSVHFLKLPDGYFCVDYSAEAFEEKAAEFGTDVLYKAYERAIVQAASKPFGELTPPVLGHINLIHKFRKRVPAEDPIQWNSVLDVVAANGLLLDYNLAGFDKPEYGSAYPDPAITEVARRLGLGFQTGSDSHHPNDIGRYFDKVPF